MKNLVIGNTLEAKEWDGSSVRVAGMEEQENPNTLPQKVKKISAVSKNGVIMFKVILDNDSEIVTDFLFYGVDYLADKNDPALAYDHDKVFSGNFEWFKKQMRFRDVITERKHVENMIDDGLPSDWVPPFAKMG